MPTLLFAFARKWYVFPQVSPTLDANVPGAVFGEAGTDMPYAVVAPTSKLTFVVEAPPVPVRLPFRVVPPYVVVPVKKLSVAETVTTPSGKIGHALVVNALSIPYTVPAELFATAR